MPRLTRREFVKGGIGALGAAAVGCAAFTSPARSRTIKESGRWFAELAATNRLVLS